MPSQSSGMSNKLGSWPVGEVSFAIVPHSSFRATVRQGKVLGIHESEVVERSECDVDEEGAENACETGKDDVADR